MTRGLGFGLGLGSRGSPARPIEETLSSLSHELLLPIQILQVQASVPDGRIVAALISPWSNIFEQVDAKPELLSDFSKHPRAFEEFIAASYDKAGFDEVILTPASGDLGRDVIAIKRGQFTVKVLDQCKAFTKGRLVSPNDVRAMMGTFLREGDAQRAVVSTTSDFAPSVRNEWKNYIGDKLELRNGAGLMEWFAKLKRNN